MAINDVNVSKDFKLEEFQSPDTKQVMVHPKLIELLQKLRDKVSRPLIVNSGYRTPEHNQSVGGVDNSQHLLGKAADISLDNLPYDADEMAEIAEEIGFNGIGKYNTFVHLDVRSHPAKWDKRGE